MMSILLGRIAALTLLAAVYSFLLAPLAAVALASLDSRAHTLFHFPPEQVSLQLYGRIPQRYYYTLGLSVMLAAVAAGGACLVGIPAALGLVRGRPKGRGAIEALFRMPLQIPFVVTGVAFLQAYYLVSEWFGLVLTGSFIGVALAHVFLTTPYVVGTVVASLERLSPRLEEAALSLGASTFATFRRVTLPLVMPGVYAGALYAFIVSFGDVSAAMFLAGTHFVTFPVEIFQAMQFDFDPAVLAISTVIVLWSLIAVWCSQRVLGFGVLLRAGGRE